MHFKSEKEYFCVNGAKRHRDGITVKWYPQDELTGESPYTKKFITTGYFVLEIFLPPCNNFLESFNPPPSPTRKYFQCMIWPIHRHLHGKSHFLLSLNFCLSSFLHVSNSSHYLSRWSHCIPLKFLTCTLHSEGSLNYNIVKSHILVVWILFRTYKTIQSCFLYCFAIFYNFIALIQSVSHHFTHTLINWLIILFIAWKCLWTI